MVEVLTDIERGHTTELLKGLHQGAMQAEHMMTGGMTEVVMEAAIASLTEGMTGVVILQQSMTEGMTEGTLHLRTGEGT